MADLPIIFSAPMVRALLDGRKTQTRRLVEVNWKDGANQNFTGWRPERVGQRHLQLIGGIGVGANIKTSYATGDRLYVREAFATGYDIDDNGELLMGEKRTWYRATDAGLTWYDPDTESTLDNPPWKPSIHMPRWASRITLTVTDVRVQRLQDISESDAQAEGAPAIGADEAPDEDERSHRWGFVNLWNSLHGPGAWEANPWVAAYTFTVARGNIDQMEGKDHA